MVLLNCKQRAEVPGFPRESGDGPEYNFKVDILSPNIPRRRKYARLYFQRLKDVFMPNFNR